MYFLRFSLLLSIAKSDCILHRKWVVIKGQQLRRRFGGTQNDIGSLMRF